MKKKGTAMKARIIVEYDVKDYELVNCLLGALQSVAINYDCREGNFRTVKGEPQWKKTFEVQSTSCTVSQQS